MEEDNSWVLNILQDLVTVVLDDKSNLKSLDIAGSGASSVDWFSLTPELLAQVLVCVDEGNFRLTSELPFDPLYELTVRCGENKVDMYCLSLDHVSSLFQMIAESSVMNIKELNLNYEGQIPHIPPELLSQAVTKLERFQSQAAFLDGVLTAPQISAVFSSLSAEKENKLKLLNLAYHNLSLVHTEILVAGISQVEEVNLAGTLLTSEELTGIYRMVADRRCSRLRKMILNRPQSDVISISQEIRSKARLNQSVYIDW